MESDKASKDIVELRLVLPPEVIFMRGNYLKNNAEANKNLVTIKRTTRNIKISLLFDLIHAELT
jgi:hypothetical protein